MKPAVGIRSVLAALLLVSATALPVHATVAVGDALPAAIVRDWQGQPVNLADLRGNVVVIDFWASWCAVCRQALPSLDAIAQRYVGAPVVFVGINIDKARPPADRFLAAYMPATTLRLLHDPDGAVLARFGAEGMPAIYVVDPQGIVRFAESGYAPERLTAVDHVVRQYLSQMSGAPAQ